ncbi:hypothetical protein AKO1_014202 [Acrasis kona]|uniref:TLC domain-containing protein n=1 Tax=Acrasis kona TaxID=1008807 RepID=A0AAW2YZ93_9EUKA
MTYTNYPIEHQLDFNRPELFGLRTYYLVACGFYMQALYGLLFIDERMKDFWEMTIHHIITIILISFSIVSSYHRAGSIIIFLHDVVDVFLYSAKAFHEIGRSNIANTLFGMFAVSFFVLRLILLPMFVLNAYFLLDDPVMITSFPPSKFLFKYVTDAYYPIEISSYGVCAFRWCLSTLWLVLIGLALLVCLHVYWFSIIFKMVMKIVLKNDRWNHDPRLNAPKNNEAKNKVV